ncbi:hypothetical protein [Psychrobacter sp. 72-O-c]|uniref:hypothetical protein n=1 Tax=Psychrobacter sp. 72-O-c TaxID=2774125 RepID=UPI001917BCC1|nr:hypothetical protein [Psychrobacter sp. 72-O-c]
MNIIDQLEQTVTSAVLGGNGSVAHLSLLEQFYAILVSRLAVPEVYTQLQRTDNLLDPVASSTLFEQLWQQSSQRHLLIQELAATHHVDERTTEQLITNAAHLAYQELKQLAEGQFLPAFLQGQQPTIRQYLPVWASSVIAPVAEATEEPALAAEALIYDNNQVTEAAIAAEQALATDNVAVVIEANDDSVLIATDAIHANPSTYHTLDTRAEVRSRNQRNDLLVRLLLLGSALLAIGLVWALFFRNDNAEPVQPVVVAPVITTPEVTPPQVLIPAQLMVGVDDSGNLYTCSATVGDINLQASIRQALMTSFGEQASICDVTVQEGVATTLASMNIATLPNVLTLMRAAPFSRLQLQNDSISLEAPDDLLLQRLLIDVRTLIPAMTITTATPIAIAQPPANTYDETYNNSNFNNGNYNDGNYSNNTMSNNGSAPITTNNNMITNQSNQQPASSNSNNIDNNIESAPPPPPRSINSNRNNLPQNNQPVQSSGPMSQAEVDAIANNTIIAEPAQGGRPVDKNAISNQ